jgi:hypothetical protein
MFSAPTPPPPPETPPAQPAAEPPKEPRASAPVPAADLDMAPAKSAADAKAPTAKTATLDEEPRRGRQQPSTVATSLRGLLRQASVGRRKTLLGE